MAAAPSTQLPTPGVPAPAASVDETTAPPPEIVKFRRDGLTGDYYQALGAAAQVRLRLLGTLHARSEQAGSASREAIRRRLDVQQRRVWQQLQWLVAEMRRLDEAGRS
jgi:hypothetical protein